MGIFSNSSPFDPIVEKATLETNTKEDWALMLDICDRVGSSSQAPKECLRSIIKRLNHQDPHVAIQAVTLLDACVNNCGLPFHLEIASRDFEQEFQKILTKTKERAIRDKLLQCLQKWASNEFRSDPQLDLIPCLYTKLRAAGVEFPAESGSPSKSKKSHSHKTREHQPSAGGGSSTAAQQEADDLAKAIELSLKETQSKSPTGRSLYPQVNSAGGSSASNSGTAKVEKEPRRVRALYDFEAAEDNELTFYAGEIVHVTDDQDPNWWEGTNQRGRGLFPSNFVTADLSAEPPKLEPVTKKQVQFSEEVTVKSVEVEPAVIEIDESKIDQTMQILHNADPTGEIPDPPELEALEDHVQQMGPLIDHELEKIDKSHAQLTRLGSELVDALNMYHNLMRGQPMMPGPPTASYPAHMMNKMPMSGPASVPNFSAVGMPQGMHPGFAPYFDPSMNGAMMNSQQMRPPQSGPSAPNSYHGMPQSQMMGPQMNGIHGPGVGHQMPSMPMPQQQNQQPHMHQQQQAMPPHMQQQPQQSIPAQMPQGVPQQGPGPMGQPQQGMQQMQHQMPPQPNMNQMPMPGGMPQLQHNPMHQMNAMSPPGVLPPQGF